MIPLRDGTYLIRRAMAVSIAHAMDGFERDGLGRKDGSDLTVVDIGGRGRPWAGTVATRLARGGRRVRHLVIDPGPSADAVGVAEALPLRTACADLVLCTQVLEHVADPLRAVAEMRRILRPEGGCLLTTHGAWFYHPDPEDRWRWTSAGLSDLFARAGFPRITVAPVGGTKLAIATLALTALDRAGGDGLAGRLARSLVVAPANLVAGRWLTARAAGRVSTPGELAINYLVAAWSAPSNG